MCYTIRAGPLSHYQPHRRWLRAQEAACTLLCVLRRQATAVSGIRPSRERGWTDIRKQTQNELYSLKPNFSLKAIEISVENGDFFVRNELESRNHTLDLLNYWIQEPSWPSLTISAALECAPCSSSSRHTSVCPSLAAITRAVSPSSTKRSVTETIRGRKENKTTKNAKVSNAPTMYYTNDNTKLLPHPPNWCLPHAQQAAGTLPSFHSWQRPLMLYLRSGQSIAKQLQNVDNTKSVNV